MFRVSEVWKHENCMDMAIRVIKISYAGPNYVKLRVLYINPRNSLPYTFAVDTIKIMRDDLKKWKLLKDSE